MQIRYAADLSVDEYIAQKAWEKAMLEKCPLHPEGGCGFSRHGTYKRKYPKLLKIARWYCETGHHTFSMLPDFLSSRLPGLLHEVENVVSEVEKSKTQAAVAEKIRLDINLPGVFRWLRLRLSLVKISLELLINFFPSIFKCQPRLTSFQSILNTDYALPKLREIAKDYLYILPHPIGLNPISQKNPFQQKTGTDPPLKIV